MKGKALIHALLWDGKLKYLFSLTSRFTWMLIWGLKQSLTFDKNGL